jgi:Holliday junction resolvase
MNETQYQAKIIKALEKKGYYVLRLISTNKNGIADLLALKHCEVWFIEVKGEKGKIAKLQEYRANEVIKHNFKHTFTFAGDNFLKDLQD